MGLILITHDLGIVARIATRVVVMYAGQVVETGTAEQIFRRPSHPYTRGLLACIPIPGRTKRGEPLGTIAGMVPSLVGAIQGCHFASRCPLAEAACRGQPVELASTRSTTTTARAASHLVRCIKPGAMLPAGAGP